MNPRTPKKKTIETFFGKSYIVIFAILIFCCAAVKLAFTLSQNEAAGAWKYVLIFDTVATLITAAALFLFFISSDTKTKTGTKIAAGVFLGASILNVITQFFVLIYYMSVSFSIITASFSLLFFGTQSLFMLYFAIRMFIDIVFKKQISAKGALLYAGAKAFSIIPVFIIRYIESELLALSNFHTPFVNATVTKVPYDELSFFMSIIGAVALVMFALLYNKFAVDCAKEAETEE